MSHPKFSLSLFAGLALVASSWAAAAGKPQPVTGQDHANHETAGVLSGAVIGGLVAGPIGAVVTAAFGSWVGDKAADSKQNDYLASALADKDQQLLAMQAEFRALEARYQVATREQETARARNVSFEARIQEAEARSACCTDSELSLHFKTRSSAVESLYDAKLVEFADLVKTLPDVVISITGHADRRGDSAANLALSQQRVDAVKNKLRDLGVTAAFMQSSAFGESMPQTPADSLEDNFFDRRVVVKVVTAGNGGYLSRAND